METPLKFHYSHPQPPLNIYRSSPPPPPSLNPNLQQQQQHQRRHHKHGGSRLAMRNLTLQRISPNRIINSLNRSHFSQSIIMSDQTKEKGPSVDASKSTLNTKQEPEKSELIPPPPEKPLPGDCCGSGCVRCVWDIYYEELEEYNNLLKSKSEHIADPKSS